MGGHGLPHLFHIGLGTYEDTQQELKNGGLVDISTFHQNTYEVRRLFFKGA